MNKIVRSCVLVTLIASLNNCTTNRSLNNQRNTVGNGRSVKIIVDTDMHTDCDDAGALAVLHALADRGECEILAIMSSTKDPYAAPTVAAINTYFEIGRASCRERVCQYV